MGKFLSVQKGVYTEREKKCLDELKAGIEPFGVLRSYSDTKVYKKWDLKVGEIPDVPVKLEDILDYNRAISTYDPLFIDEEYAKNSCNGGIVAYYDMLPPAQDFPAPASAMGDEFFFANEGGVMELFDFVRPGDCLRAKTIDAGIEDISEDGSDIRKFRIWRTAEMYNKEGKLLGRGTYRGRNGFKTFADPSNKPTRQMLADESFGLVLPPERITTDDDWEYIRDAWSKEKWRGAETLFWEDVQANTYIPERIEAPISYLDLMRMYGRSFMKMTDIRGISPVNLDKLHYQRDHKGVYFPLFGMMFGNRGRAGGRAIMFNNTPRDFIFRMICSWMGDEGFIRKYEWCFPQAIPELHIPNDGHEVMSSVPGYEGRGCERHGTEGNTSICKGYITKKYILNGEHLVDLACWAETLDHEILSVCPITVRLRSRES